jgi:hypothetical protein
MQASSAIETKKLGGVCLLYSTAPVRCGMRLDEEAGLVKQVESEHYSHSICFRAIARYDFESGSYPFSFPVLASTAKSLRCSGMYSPFLHKAFLLKPGEEAQYIYVSDVFRALTRLFWSLSM